MGETENEPVPSPHPRIHRASAALAEHPRGPQPGSRRVGKLLHTPTIHVARDQYHLAWDPAIPPVATVASGAIVEFDCLDASNGQFTADSTTVDASRPSTSAGSTRSTARSRSPAPSPATASRSTSSSSRPADWGWTASIPGFGLLADDFPEPSYRSRAVPRPAGAPSSCPGSASRWRRSAARSASRRRPARAATIPPDLYRRQHGHPPPDRRVDAVPARLRRGRPRSRSATATRPRATARSAAPPSRRRCGRSSA